MLLEKTIRSFSDLPAIHITQLVCPLRCRALIEEYLACPVGQALPIFIDEFIAECADTIFTNDLHAFLLSYFQSKYQLLYTSFDVVEKFDSTPISNARWHVDAGIEKTLKLFVYLNGVDEHGGNTLMYDRYKTKKLRESGHLPVAGEERKVDLNSALSQLGLDTDYLAYNLKAGDGLLFNPIALAHRCLPPREGERRYTICFTVIPSIGHL